MRFGRGIKAEGEEEMKARTGKLDVVLDARDLAELGTGMGQNVDDRRQSECQTC